MRLPDPNDHNPWGRYGVLFLCVQNSGRSQIAEGWAREFLPLACPVWSAGSSPAANVHPTAVAVMQEAGIDISAQTPKRLSDVPFADLGVVITLCAEQVCPPLPPTVRHLNWTYPDPVDETSFRQVRNALRHRIARLAQEHSASDATGRHGDLQDLQDRSAH